MSNQYKYYKGEKSNPFEEVNEKQGLWCNRYNVLASLFWFFEYYWEHGYDAYSKLEDRYHAYWFEKHQQPQKEFASILDALCSFAWDASPETLINGCKRWVKYLYDNAHQERFYKPLYNIVPAQSIPNYLHWYKGESENPYQADSKAFWWMFEMGWYRTAEELSKDAWDAYLETYFARGWHGSTKDDGYKQHIDTCKAAYLAGTPYIA